MKSKQWKMVLVAGMVALAFCLAGCGASQAINTEPIVGTWESVNSGQQDKFSEDGTFTYTNESFDELGYLKGTWEKNEGLPSTVQADGKTWTVYLVINEARTAVGEGEGGNKYDYNDKYGDYYYLVSEDERALTIGAASVSAIAENGKLSELQKDFMSKRIAG